MTAFSGLSDFSSPTIALDPQGNVISPKKYNWLLRRTVGSPVKVGRAPLPVPAAAMMQPTSPDHKGWAVGSAYPGWWYGWRGGDGKEIAFTGYGPDAERNPNPPVNFRAFDNNTVQTPTTQVPQGGVVTPSSFGVERAPHAPRKMREWASNMGYSHVPCGQHEIVQAVEHITLPRDPNGWCGRCAPTQSFGIMV